MNTWKIDFIGPVYTTLGTTDYYNAVTDLHTLQFAVTHAFATDFVTVSLSLQITQEVFFSHPNFFLAISASANPEDSTQFSSSAPNLISRQAGVSKLDQFLLS
jgi:hypothetical protein